MTKPQTTPDKVTTPCLICGRYPSIDNIPFDEVNIECDCGLSINTSLSAKISPVNAFEIWEKLMTNKPHNKCRVVGTMRRAATDKEMFEMTSIPSKYPEDFEFSEEPQTPVCWCLACAGKAGEIGLECQKERYQLPNREEKDPFSAQIAGAHYKDFAIQPAEFFFRNEVPPLEAQIIGYLLRWRKKNGVQDLDKAIHMAQMLKALAERENGS